MKHNLTEQEFRTALEQTKALLSEASAKGALNDFWVVIDCDSENFRDYLHRSNTQGLIDIVCKKHKALLTRKVLNDIALFAAGDKDKAEKEAKRRAKNMKDELVNEAGCAGCDRNKKDHLAAAKQATHEAKMVERKNPAAAKAYTAKAKFETSLANEKCGECRKKEKDSKKKVDENFYDPRNVVAAKGNLPSSTDDTIYSANPSDRQDKVSGAKPGPHDPTDPEHQKKVKVPSSITSILESRAKDARAYSDKLPVTHTDDKQFYSDLAVMFEDLNEYLKSGTVHDIKMANIFMNTLMGPMLNEIPTEVSRFISYGGTHAPLKSFVNSISVPQGGFGIKTDIGKK